MRFLILILVLTSCGPTSPPPETPPPSSEPKPVCYLTDDKGEVLTDDKGNKLTCD